jgi:hypothetical protein
MSIFVFLNTFIFDPLAVRISLFISVTNLMLSSSNGEDVRMPSRREVIVKRKAKDVGFLANEECPVYKKQFKEKCRNSCMQCNKNFKKAAYLRRHMQNIHAYTITGLDQVVKSSTQERNEDIFSRMSTNHAKVIAPIKRKINRKPTSLAFLFTITSLLDGILTSSPLLLDNIRFVPQTL